MNIIIDHPTLTLNSPVMLEMQECLFALRLTTMKGETVLRPGNVCIGVPNTREALPERPTLGDVVRLVIRRMHPVYQYVAEQNGVVVESYFERWSFAQSISCIAYGIETNNEGQATRLYL